VDICPQKDRGTPAFSGILFARVTIMSWILLRHFSLQLAVSFLFLTLISVISGIGAQFQGASFPVKVSSNQAYAESGAPQSQAASANK
jgi:hypothetical protein